RLLKTDAKKTTEAAERVKHYEEGLKLIAKKIRENKNAPLKKLQELKTTLDSFNKLEKETLINNSIKKKLIYERALLRKKLKEVQIKAEKQTQRPKKKEKKADEVTCPSKIKNLNDIKELLKYCLITGKLKALKMLEPHQLAKMFNDNSP